MLSKILFKTLLLVILSAGAVVSIFDPNYTERTKTYHRDPHIARELRRQQQGIPIPTYHRSESNPRLSSFSRYQQESRNVQQQERHANYNHKDYANNLDEYYGGCPSGFTGLLSYPYDCRRFVNCWKGRAYIQTCGPGTVFNGETLECDSPSKVVCKGLNALQPKTNEGPSNNRLARMQQNNDESEAVSCPAGHTGLLPHPNDCSKFLNCASGTMHIQNCGPYTMFNTRMKVCDFASKVDCTGRGGGSSSPPSSSGQWNGNRGGKKFETTTRDNQAAVPQRKGWPQRNHNHQHGFHHGFHHEHSPSFSGFGSFAHHHNHNCTEAQHSHYHQHHTSSPQPAIQTPLIFRDRWSNMNRTRPNAPTPKTPSWTPMPSQRPIPPSQNNWQNSGSSRTTPQPNRWVPSLNWPHHDTPSTTTPASNYPNIDSETTPTPVDTTDIYYAQPVDYDQPSEEVFTNVVGGDITQISLPAHRGTFGRGVFVPNVDPPSKTKPHDPSMDAINIPNTSLMPPHPTSANVDQNSKNPSRKPISVTPGRFQPTPPNRRPNYESPQINPVRDYDDSLDAISIPSMNLMPPLPSDDGQFEVHERNPPFPPPTPPPSRQPPARPAQNTPRPSGRPKVGLEPAYEFNVRNGMGSPGSNTRWADRVPPSTTPKPGDTTKIFYAQPVDENQPSDEVFSNVGGSDINTLYLPGHRGTFSNGVFFPDSPSSQNPASHDPSMDVINIPNMNLMPPLPTSSTDEGNFQATDQDPLAYSPDSYQTTPSYPQPDDSYPDYSAQYPSFVFPESKPAFNPQSRDFSPNQSKPPSRSPKTNQPYDTNPIIVSPTPPPEQQDIWFKNDESNLFGGMLPPLPPATPSEYTPSSPNPPARPLFSTTPPPGTKTNVRVFQIYPPPAVQNATTKIHPNPFYSPSYSGVAHSRNTTWSNIKTNIPRNPTPVPRTSTTTTTPYDNFEPDIVFSHDGGVVIASRHHMSPTTTQHHGLSPPSYNREFYKPTTPMSVQRAAPLETEINDKPDQMPLSEALKLLLRPYINRSGTVTDDMVSKAESHIMNLSHSNEPSTTSTSTSTVTPTTTHKDVEIIFAGEQNSLTPSNVHPIHSQVQHLPSSKYHERHDRNFHQRHPHLPNPFGNENGKADDSVLTTTPMTLEETTLVDQVAEDVCQFDCGNGQCVKTFETCDGVNHCGNRRDEEQCDHLGYELRLSNEGFGRVEVKILGQWGYVCDDKFGIQDANVVCRELGFPLGASDVHGNSFYPPTDGGEVAFVMDEVDCSGNETSLKDCHFMGWGVSDCGPDEVVGVQCKTPVMTCPNDYWLCSTSKECIPPAFVCDNVPDCSDKSDESSAVCNSTVEFRLRGGNVKEEGRLEVMYRGVWGTICDDDFGQTEAQVACNSLGYYGPAKIVKNAFGPGTGPIWLDQLSCFGNETTLDTCNHWSWGEHNCNHTEDVSLKCTKGSPPRTPNTPTKNTHSSEEDVQALNTDDIGMDLYPMERSSKAANPRRKICGHFNANLTDEIPQELERVVKGNIAKRGRHPWQATIRTKGRGGISSHWCGAVLISKKHLLTAAHCLVGYPKGAYFIRLGDHYANIAESSEIDSYIENWYIHEKFREGTHMNNDIAVIVMKNPVRFNDYIQPICLPQEGTEYKEGRRCTISGWGSIQSGVSTPSNNLRVAEIPVISDEVCKLPHVYGSSVTEGMFCAGFLEEGVDACEGDSGGPFVCSDSDAETLYGIISWGQQCGHANKPGVYVKIEKYLDWIYDKIRFSMQQTN